MGSTWTVSRAYVKQPGGGLSMCLCRTPPPQGKETKNNKPQPLCVKCALPLFPYFCALQGQGGEDH